MSLVYILRNAAFLILLFASLQFLFGDGKHLPHCFAELLRGLLGFEDLDAGRVT